MEKIYFSKVKSNAIIPSKKEEDAGYDIYACFDEDYIIIPPHKTVIIPTGIASAFSPKYYFQLEERGSTGTKGVGQRCGVIDSGFRGEWGVPITNHNDEKELVISKSHVTWEQSYRENNIIYPYEKAICQAIFLPVPETEVLEIDYETLLTFTSERGKGCLGSSGK